MSKQIKQGTKNVHKRIFNEENDTEPAKKGKLAGFKKAATRVVAKKLKNLKQTEFVPKFDKPMTRARSANCEKISTKVVKIDKSQDLKKFDKSKTAGSRSRDGTVKRDNNMS